MRHVSENISKSTLLGFPVQHGQLQCIIHPQTSLVPIANTQPSRSLLSALPLQPSLQHNYCISHHFSTNLLLPSPTFPYLPLPSSPSRAAPVSNPIIRAISSTNNFMSHLPKTLFSRRGAHYNPVKAPRPSLTNVFPSFGPVPPLPIY